MKASGFAVAVDEVIDVRTVSPSERGAKVNWLYGLGINVLDTWSDDIIERVWQHYSTGLKVDVQCIAVVITAKESNITELGQAADLETAISPDGTVNIQKDRDDR